MGRHSRAGSLVSSVLSAVVYQADMHFDKETHRERERPRLQFSADRVRKRQEKTEISGKEARVTLAGRGGGFSSGWAGSRNRGKPEQCLASSGHLEP